MAVYDKLPESNLRAEDIRDTLLANGADWSNSATPNANYLPNYFRKESNINMWSLKKPVRSDSLFPFNGIEESIDKTYDIKTPMRDHNPDDYYRNLPEILQWRWLGGLMEGRYPLRLSDFRGYNSRAKTPVHISREVSDINLHGNSKVLNMRLDRGDIDPNKLNSGMTWNNEIDIPISEFRIHLVFFSEYSIQNALFVSKPISELDFSIPVPFNRRLGALENRTYRVRPFLVYEKSSTPIYVFDFFNDNYYNLIDDILINISGVKYDPIEDSPYVLNFSVKGVLLEDMKIGNLGEYPVYSGNNIADTITIDGWYPEGTQWAMKCTSKKDVMLEDMYIDENGTANFNIDIRKYDSSTEEKNSLNNLVGTFYRDYKDGKLSNKITKTSVFKLKGDYYIHFNLGRNEIIKKLKNENRFFSEVTINYKGHFVTYFILSIINKNKQTQI